MSTAGLHELDQMMRDSWRALADRLSESPKGEAFTLTSEDKELLLMQLRRSVDISPIIDALADVLAGTLVDWKKTPKKEAKKGSAES